MIVLTDEGVTRLYKMVSFLMLDVISTGSNVKIFQPIQLTQVEVKELTGKGTSPISQRAGGILTVCPDDLGFQLVFAYPRGGEAMAFKATSPRECQVWVKAISSACRRAREVERKAARASKAYRR